MLLLYPSSFDSSIADDDRFSLVKPVLVGPCLRAKHAHITNMDGMPIAKVKASQSATVTQQREMGRRIYAINDCAHVRIHRQRDTNSNTYTYTYTDIKSIHRQKEIRVHVHKAPTDNR